MQDPRNETGTLNGFEKDETTVQRNAKARLSTMKAGELVKPTNDCIKDAQIHQEEYSRIDTPMQEGEPNPKNSVDSKLSGLDEQAWSLHCTVTATSMPMSDELIMEPYRYLSSLPGKGVRNIAIDAFNVWLGASAPSVSTVKSAINILHSSSLMLDDLEDRSPLRRGKPSTHVVFGAATTINSATFLYLQVISVLEKLQCTPPDAALALYTAEMHNLFVGQSYDNYWTATVTCPSLNEYIQMVDGKTGGLFRLSVGLLASCAPARVPKQKSEDGLDHLCSLIGRYFQIRDDYQNLASPEYTSQKGFCEDLDEGKFSLPLILTLTHSSNPIMLRSLLQQRRRKGIFSHEQKQLVLDAVSAAGGLQRTLVVLRGLYGEIEREVGRLENVFAMRNEPLRKLLGALQM